MSDTTRAQADEIIRTVCRTHGCIFVSPGVKRPVELSTWHCSKQEGHFVIQLINGKGCRSATTANPTEDPIHEPLFIRGTMITEGFTPSETTDVGITQRESAR